MYTVLVFPRKQVTLYTTGLVYFVFKHLVDKHNLAFVYAHSKINKNVHRFDQNISLHREKGYYLEICSLQKFHCNLKISFRSENIFQVGNQLCHVQCWAPASLHAQLFVYKVRVAIILKKIKQILNFWV